ncbi:ABC transporter substrate-binding protein [Paenibacillus sp. CAA11]|uniref:menaquinone biosynthesis protein n=1 Tax=Paenibacillus sp. CAA11 TaxID=1532905 RepID=UPI000D373178|nr:menaquinone biosynthesis protein [Paenibacillus sp. CAA11]AWB46939.1 ABC transporter substrate-binding protein [Paenibacillus sp. CAA11]
MGKIVYTNVWPVFHHFHPEMISPSIQMVTEVPAVLNRALLAGELDLSPVSSFAYGTGSDSLKLLPGLSVSSDGPVNSILVFSRKPFKETVNGVIALTNTSATSVNLLKIIVEKAFGGKPTYWNSEPTLDQMMEKSDAALLIGDHAIRASWTDHGYYVTDLGQVWKEWTGLGMTFAVWAVQEDFAERNAELLGEIVAAFQDSKRRSLQDLRPLSQQACAEIGGTEAYWMNYFRTLRHDLSDRQQEGLALYYKYAYEMGLLNKPVDMRIWNDTKLMRVK